MKMAMIFVPASGLMGPRNETLIQTEMGTFFILDEDLLTGEVNSRRITLQEANDFQALSKSGGRIMESCALSDVSAYGTT